MFKLLIIHILKAFKDYYFQYQVSNFNQRNLINVKKQQVYNLYKLYDYDIFCLKNIRFIV